MNIMLVQQNSHYRLDDVTYVYAWCPVISSMLCAEAGKPVPAGVGTCADAAVH